MFRSVCILVVILNCGLSEHFHSFDDFLKERNGHIQGFFDDSIAGGNILTSKESEVATIINKMKMKEVDLVRGDNTEYVTIPKFTQIRDQIEQTDLYNVMKLFPKGGVLHGHLMSMMKSDWVYENGILRDDCYRYIGPFDGEYFPGMYKLFKPGTAPKEKWVRFLDLRNKTKDVKLFDEVHMAELQMNTTSESGSGQRRWLYFGYIYNIINQVLSFDEVYKAFFFELVDRLVLDNVFYIELCTNLGNLFNYERIYSAEEQVIFMKNISDQAKAKYSFWQGVKIRQAVAKDISPEGLKTLLSETVIPLQSKYPDFVIGFDLVGEEDTNSDTFTFAEILYNAKQSYPQLRYIFHAGESDWWNYNILDSILLGTERIGHGFNLYRYPNLIPLVKERGIAIEICPVSNHVLGLSRDLRAHMFVNLIAQDVPMVISPDDPGFFGYDGCSFDFYFALMSIGYGLNDLLVLKKLAMNSITYSMMDEVGKKNASSVWIVQYDSFLDKAIRMYG